MANGTTNPTPAASPKPAPKAPQVDTGGSGGGHKGMQQLLIAVVVILVLLAVGFWLYSFVGPSGPGGGLGEGEELMAAPPGEIIAGFPNELLIEETSDVRESYAIMYRGVGVSQPVVRYRSTFTLEENIVAFRDYFIEASWEVLQDANPESNVPFFYATRQGEQVNITFATDGDGMIIVTIAYAQQN